MTLRLCALFALLAPTVCGDRWDGVRDAVAKWSKIGNQNWKNFSVSVGDASGNLFVQNVGNQTMNTSLVVASSSKWPAASAIVGVVAQGLLKWGSHPQDVLPFWTKDPSDWRSQITLHQLLTFTSGFFSTDEVGDVACQNNFTANFMDCVKDIHDKAIVKFLPGSTFDYNSYHLQIAGAMACAVTGLTPEQFFSKYLIGRVGMRNSSYTNWGQFTNPQFAATLQTNGADYERFLHSYFTYKLLPKNFTDEMEKDQIKGLNISANSYLEITGEGDYSMGNFFECAYNTGHMRPACLTASIHCDPGLFGFYPLVDRRHKYYMEIVYMGMDTGAAEGGYLARAFIKPSVDKAIQGLAEVPGEFEEDRQLLAERARALFE